MIQEYIGWLKNNEIIAPRVLSIQKETISDGIGLRLSIYLSGCAIKCEECHNKQSWDYQSGSILDEKLLNEILNAYKDNPLLNGITITGGDPYYYPEALLQLLKVLKGTLNCNIWVYTGNVFDNIKDTNTLEYIDILVEGPFIKSLYRPDLVFKGSSNQRIIDVKKTLDNNAIMEIIFE